MYSDLNSKGRTEIIWESIFHLGCPILNHDDGDSFSLSAGMMSEDLSQWLGDIIKEFGKDLDTGFDFGHTFFGHSTLL